MAALARWSLLSAINARRDPIEVGLEDGHRLLVNPTDFLQCEIGVTGGWEKAIYDAVKPLVKAGDVVLDIGGHVGYSTVLFADWVGRDGRVMCYEPFPGHARRIEENVLLNGFRDRVVITQAAVSSRNATAVFRTPGRLNAGTGSLASAHGHRRHMQVRTVSLDSELAAVTRPVALGKLDIEGAEGEALRGMRETLSRQTILTLLVELHPAEMREFGDSVPQLASMLKEYGYTMSYWSPAGYFTAEDLSATAGYALATVVEPPGLS